jgi:transcriptional regulator with XRE-family HTH domain
MEGMEVDSIRLFELRVEKMLSQEDLHQLSGVSRDTISRLERGESQAQYRTIRKLADALEVPYRELLKKG